MCIPMGVKMSPSIHLNRIRAPFLYLFYNHYLSSSSFFILNMSNYFQNTAIKDLCLNKFDVAYKKEHVGCSKVVAHEKFADFLNDLTERDDLTEAEKKKVDSLKQQLKQCKSDPENTSIWSKKITRYLNGNGIKQSIMYDNSSKWVEADFDVSKALMSYRDKAVQSAEASRLLSDSQFLSLNFVFLFDRFAKIEYDLPEEVVSRLKKEMKAKRVDINKCLLSWSFEVVQKIGFR
ncbi:hypothetical protein A0J61_10140 [Choanephora cucurbitarum]|uniref:Uncharacterized protein n=1 Tax=Choanephora cucurbitarum TaxID=101091 RepID=A0A1C7MYE8_9FUNG|nr:hypothetical protein A0J61_10140 [Choanephora cucurbitarum]